MTDLAVMDFELVLVEEWMYQANIPMGTVRYDAQHRFHANDLVAAYCGYGRDSASRILKSVLKSNNMSAADFVEGTYFGGKQKFKMVGFKNLFRLIMVIPLPNASNRRQEFARVLHNFFAGDQHLLLELQLNAKSKDQFCVIARECLDAERAAVTVATSGVLLY